MGSIDDIQLAVPVVEAVVELTVAGGGQPFVVQLLVVASVPNDNVAEDAKTRVRDTRLVRFGRPSQEWLKPAVAHCKRGILPKSQIVADE